MAINFIITFGKIVFKIRCMFPIVEFSYVNKSKQEIIRRDHLTNVIQGDVLRCMGKTYINHSSQYYLYQCANWQCNDLSFTSCIFSPMLSGIWTIIKVFITRSLGSTCIYVWWRYHNRRNIPFALQNGATKSRLQKQTFDSTVSGVRILNIH